MSKILLFMAAMSLVFAVIFGGVFSAGAAFAYFISALLVSDWEL